MAKKIIRYGMVGGSLNAFIGGVHRQAINYEPMAKLVAGCFTRNEELNEDTGEVYNIDKERVYKDYNEMAETESGREDKIDFVVICAPNYVHYEIAKEFLLKGINVVCEKPLCFEVEQGEALKEIAKEKDLIFVVTYSYSGYPMVKFAKQLIKDRLIGEIININAEFPQEWLIDEIGEDNGNTTIKLSGWRTDPKIAGISNCIGDIGSHIENTIAYVTGLKVKKVAAKIDRFGQQLDLNANMLIEYDNGCSGNYWCSQISVGNMNGLTFRIYGTKGAIEWDQEHPEYLKVTEKGKAPQTMARGNAYVYGMAEMLNRLPSGHPEGYYEAFANLYKIVIGTIAKKKYGEELTEADYDYPTIDDGIDGVKFIHAAIESGDNNSKWVDIL